MAAKKKTANLSVVDDAARQEWLAKRNANDESWEKAEKGLRITRHGARQRAKAIRNELELYREQVEAIPFDIASGDLCPPYCLDTNIRRRYALELVEDLNPLVKGLFDLIDNYADKHGTHKFLDFNSRLFNLKHEAAETGFRIGVLAGVMFAGAPKEVIDRFERGLAFAMSSRSNVVKQPDEKE